MATLAAGCTSNTAPAPAEEVWDVVYMNDAKLGYVHTQVRPLDESGRKLRQTDSTLRVSASRGGSSFESEMQFTSVETPQGDVVRFSSRVEMGTAPMQATGKPAGGKMVIQSTLAGQTTESRIDWPAATRGFFGQEQSLVEKPMAPGEKRSLQLLAPVFNRVATVDLEARDYAKTQLLDREESLLEIRVTARLPGAAPIRSVAWTDGNGRTLKSLDEATRQVTYRTTRERALAPGKGKPPDLMIDLLVRLDKPLGRLDSLRQARFLVELDRSDPAKVFPTGSGQSVKSLGPHQAEVTVCTLRPGDGHAGKADREAPPAEAAKPSAMIQSDDATILEMAREAAGVQTDPARLAVALERYVHTAIKTVEFSQAVASAAEVAKSRSGDCTEFAVLLAALARARGIPARVAVGLVYVDGQQAFGYHMWTEVHVGGQWIPLDATLDQRHIAAPHLKLGDSYVSDSSFAIAFLPVLQVMGRLKVKLLAAE